MLQTVKSSFLILVIFTMSSAVYAADNNGETKQPETIILKTGTQVKSTRVYDGVPSQQHMDAQGKSIEEIKGPDISTQETPADKPSNRGVSISSWSTEDYIKVTPQKFHNALRNQTVPSNKSYHPQRIVVPGEETTAEQKTAPISTWGVQDYLNVTPTDKHKAIKEMQKAPLVIPGEAPDVIPQKKPINELDRKDKQSNTQSAIYNSISNQGGTFTVGSSRSFDEITITVSTDYYYTESSWNLYDSTAEDFYYDVAQTFSSNNETQTVTLALAPGAYAVVAYDSYGDAGITGSVADANGISLVEFALSTSNGTGALGVFGFTVSSPTHDVTIALTTDYWYSEASWQLFDDAGAAVNTLQLFSSSSETQTVTLSLENGGYSLMTYDVYGDGGVWGTVTLADGTTLVTITNTSGYSNEYIFALGLYDVTLVIEVDYWVSEGTWNLYNSTDAAYYYTANQGFTTSYETDTVHFSLNEGVYSIDLWDAAGDGGMSGSVTAGNWTEDTTLVTFVMPWSNYSSHEFGVAPPGASAPDLFFSEYIEGSSNNKAIELYNPTEDTLDLDDYLIYGNYNGNDFNNIYVFPVGATLAPGDVFVAAHSSAVEEVLQAADSAYAYAAGAYITSYNGDDVRALAKIKDADTSFIDVIGTLDGDGDGTPGEGSEDDPGSGFDVAGITNATKDHTLIRKPAVAMGNIDWTASAGTGETDSEWIVYESNYFDNIGGHPENPCWGYELTFTFNTGGYGSEVNYYVESASGDTLASCFSCMASNQTYTTDLCMEDGGSYTVWGMDSYGDTWNGGYWVVTDSEGSVVATGSGPASGVSNEYVPVTFAIGEAGVNVSGSTGFDGLVLNDSETNDVFVTNSGYGASSVLMVDSVKTTNNAFSASGVGTTSLAFGHSDTLQVTFTPTEEESYEAYLVVYSDAATSPDSFMVSGFGVDAYFYEGFDPHSGSATDFSTLPMTGWTILDNNGDAGDSIPQQYKTWYHDDFGVGSSGNMVAYYGYSSSYDADEQLISPLIHTPGLAKLSFKTYDYDQYLGVGYSVDGTTFMGLAEVFVDAYWQQHDITLPEVDSLWLEFTFDPDSGSSTYSTYLNIDEIKVTAMPNTYLDGWVEDQDTDLGVGGVSVVLNGSEVTTTGENELFLHPGFEDSSFVANYNTAPDGGWWVYPPELTNFSHVTDGDSIYVDTSQALGPNELSVHEGDKALKMWGQYPVNQESNYTSIYQQMGAVDEGQEMYVGAWAMTHSDGPLADGSAFYVAINWLDVNWGWLGQDQGEWMDTSHAVGEWHYVDVHGTAPAGVAYVQLQLTYYQDTGNSTGNIYVDAAQATMHPGHYRSRGMDAGTYLVTFSKDDYNSAVFNNVEITDDVADTTRLDVGLAPFNMTEFEAGFEADQDSGSTVITSGSASFMVMDSLRLTVTDSTVYTDTTATGVDTTWTVYDTTEYNVDPYMGDGMLVYGPTGSQGSVYEDSAYAMWVSGESFDITDYMGEGGNLSMYYRRNMNVATGDYFYVGVMLDDSTVWWGDYNDHTGTTNGSWYYQSADLTWLRELGEDSSTTATPVIIFDSNDSLVVGWGGAFDDFHVDGNPWFLMKPGHLHAESFGSNVPLHWDEPMSSGRVSYQVHSFHMSELGGSQPPTIQTRTVTSEFDNSAIPRDVISYGVHRRHWDAGTMQIGAWEPLVVTNGTSYFDFGLSDGDRADYRIYVRYEDGDMTTPSNTAHARAGVPYVMLVDSFATTTTFDSTFGDHWELWSGSESANWVIGDSAAAHGASGYTGTVASNYIPEHPDSAGTFAYISNGQTPGKTVLMTPFLDFGGHASALLEFDAFAMTYGTFYDPAVYTYADHAAVYARSQSDPWHLAVNLAYSHSADGWVQERADLGWLVGNRDRVQFAIVWEHGTSNNYYGDILAIDDFSVKTLAGPTNLTATATTESVTLNWEGVDGRRANEYPEQLSAEEKALAIQVSNTAIGKAFSQTGSMNKSLTTTDDDVVVTNNNSRDTGDDISDPFILTIPESGDTLITGSTVGFTNDYDAVCPYSGSTSPDVVYKLVLADSINGLIIDLCESYYDSKVYMYLEDSLATGDTTNVACNDDYCSASHGQSWTSYIELGHQLFGGVSAGTYYIVIDGYGGNSGEYVMNVTVMSPPPEMVYNVFKDDQMVAVDLPDSVFTYMDNNVSLMESAYWVNAARIMELSSDRPFYGPPNYVTPPADFDIRYVQTDHTNHVWAAKVNTPPGAFALVTPPDGQALEITHDNIGSNQIFAWSSSVDPNGSVVTYYATLQVPTGTDTLEISMDTTGTAVLIPYASIADVMTVYATATGNYTADVSWTVYADDGWDEIEASNGPRSLSVDIGWYLGMNDEAIIPDVFALHQNYPNPFNPVTTIRYDIPEQALVRIDIYNILGQKVAVLAEGLHEPGFHAVRWNGTNMYGNALSSGMYFYHIKAGDFRNVKKLLLVK